jgi:Gpi18-like mannosyltransferase
MKAFWGKHKILLLTAIASYVITLFFIDSRAWAYDVSLFKKWAIAIKDNGLSNIYANSNQVDYLPGFLYILKTYVVFFGSSVEETIHFLKAFVLFFEVLAVFVICTYIQQIKWSIFLFLIGVFNWGYLYNNLAWFQIDGWLASTMLFSFLLALQKNTKWSIFLFVIAINIKFQSIIILPLLGLIWLNQIKSPKEIASFLGVFLLTEIVILSPFIVNGSAKFIFQNVFNTYDLFPYVSLNARNLWMLIEFNPRFIPDDSTFIIFSYKQWGLSLYILSILGVILPYSYWCFFKKIKISHQFLILGCIILSYSFFFLNTQMHERYIHYAFPFVMMYCFLNKSILIFILFSLANYLNLESMLHFQTFIPHTSFLFNAQFIAVLFAIVYLFFVIKFHLINKNISKQAS